MNKSLLISAAICLALLPLPQVASAAPKCSLKTLKGTYIYGATGVKNGAMNVEAGQDIFDGKGNIQNTYTDSQGVTIVTTGTYTMSSNCTGVSTYKDSGVSYEIFTGPKGDLFSWISVSDNYKISGQESRVSGSLKPKCSLKTLTGTYVYSQMGYRNGTHYLESGQETYDGKGNITTTYADPKGQLVTTSGTYTLDQNCVGESSYTDTGDSYALYPSPKGDEFRFVSKTSSSNNLTAGSENRVSTALIK
jgi:hypothetical protein